MKFSIRDLFWLTVVVALAVAWWLDSARKEAELNKANEAELENEGRAVLAEGRVENAKAIIDQLRASVHKLPASSAPAPNPP